MDTAWNVLRFRYAELGGRLQLTRRVHAANLSPLQADTHVVHAAHVGLHQADARRGGSESAELESWRAALHERMTSEERERVVR